MSEEQIAPERRDDWREVRNYIEAVNTAIAELKNVPLSNRLVRQTHAILMQRVRGEHKQPGEFRSSQNWIGGSSLTDCRLHSSTQRKRAGIEERSRTLLA